MGSGLPADPGEAWPGFFKGTGRKSSVGINDSCRDLFPSRGFPGLRRAGTLRQRFGAAGVRLFQQRLAGTCGRLPTEACGIAGEGAGAAGRAVQKNTFSCLGGGSGGPCDLPRLDEEEEAELARVGASLELPSEPGFPSQPGSPGAEALMKPARLFA